MKALSVFINVFLSIVFITAGIFFIPIVHMSAKELLSLMPHFMSLSGVLVLESTRLSEAVFPALIMPSSITFYIWVVVYVMLLYFCINQVISFFTKQETAKTIDTISWWYALALVLNIIWYFLWYYDYVLYSLMVCATLLIVLTIIYRHINQKKIRMNSMQWLANRMPFSLYTAWISIIFTLNCTYYLLEDNWKGFGLRATTWSIIICGFLGFLALMAILRKRDFTFAAVIVWYFIGVLIKRYNAPIIYLNVITAVWIYIVLICGVSIIKILIPAKNKKSRRKTANPQHKDPVQQT